MAMRSDSSQHSFGWEAYFNRGLFADHFLEHRLRELPEWREADGLENAFKALQKRYRQYAVRFSKRTNEAQTEHDFVQPVLDILWRDLEPGDCYQVQVRIPNLDADRQPDYAFFRAAADHASAAPKVGTMDFWRDVPCLGDAKKWSASLDRDPAAHESPTAQVSNYLYRSRVRWGILTNGRIWRLYEREKSSAGGIYFEANLEAILKQANPEPFKYFYLFFRREAFLPDAKGATFLEKVFQGSVHYAEEVSDRLNDSVYDALRLLMNGFFQHAANGLDRKDPATLALVHENSLIVLYRLLFLLYAEDRDLLPLTDETYASYSLYRLHREINQHLRQGKSYLAAGRTIWGSLTNLFQLIDAPAGDVGIPTYNGGLFKPERYPHLAHTPQPSEKRWEIGDRFLAEAIDRLAFKRERWDEPGSSDVDYATLEVQHLGSIYEGLLELQPHVAAESLVEQLEDGKPVFKPARQVPNPRPVRGQSPRTVAQGDVYLVTDRGERKSTGSYYTPKYIVDFIVQNTVGPLTEGASRQVAKLSPHVEKQISHLQRKRRQFEQRRKQGQGAAVARDIANLDRQIDEQKQKLLEPYLGLRVLDPAMGSGHFLVGAADFLSREMANDPNLLRLAPEAAGDNPQAYYKRRVVERCLYGVDLNMLAVELAKLSLWLHTVSKDKALSFLDHHLRCGNTLVGTSIQEDLMNEPPRATASGLPTNRNSLQPRFAFTEIFKLAHIQSFLDTFRKIGNLPGGSAESERNKDDWYRVMDADREKFRAVANCWLAPLFGVCVGAEQYEEAIGALRGAGGEWERLREQEWFRQAQDAARRSRNRFFHWELEFPEAFFDARGFKSEEERGFDVTLGNPPYVNVTNIEGELRDYLLSRFETATGRFDLYITFTERALSLLKSGGKFGFIQPIKFAIYANGRLLREILLDRTQITTIVDVSQCRVFPDPTTYPCLPIVTKCLPASDHKLVVVQAPPDKPEAITRRDPEVVHILEIPQTRFRETPERVICLRLSDDLWASIKRADKVSSALGSAFEIEQCIRIGSAAKRQRLVLDEAQYRSAPPAVRAECRRMLDGANLSHYSIAWDGSWLHYLPRELYNPKSAEVLETQKILIKRIAPALTAVPDLGKDGGYYYPLNTIYALVPKKGMDYSMHYVSALLNSKYLDWYYKLLFEAIAIRGGYIEYREYLKYVPIRRVEFSTPRAERRAAVKHGEKAIQAYLSSGNPAGVLDHLGEQLYATPERCDVVHDLLALLAERMVQMNALKRTEANGFLTWLQRKVGADVATLSNRTKLYSYYEHPIETVLHVLSQNRRRLSVDPGSRAVQESIEREHAKSLDDLNPLRAEISATDDLINLIVYRLYGLTEKEIAIVKGGLSPPRFA